MQLSFRSFDFQFYYARIHYGIDLWGFNEIYTTFDCYLYLSSVTAYELSSILAGTAQRSGHLQTFVPCSRRATDHLLAIIVPFP